MNIGGDEQKGGDEYRGGNDIGVMMSIGGDENR